MTRRQILSALRSGKRLTFAYWKSGEWVTMNKDERLVYEDGSISPLSFDEWMP